MIQLTATSPNLFVAHEDVLKHNWATFFAPHLKNIPEIKKFHHFRCVSSEPGVVYMKQDADTEEEKINLNKSSMWLSDSNKLPGEVPPKGLSAERKWYLFRLTNS